ncbi:hypothetical protein ACFVX6_33240 [Streptomyces sp. NPDC058289]|uniref:hypothetical protein n=1 Tax=Streptomyces sp. NPDC058289 TaxID=3346425 RepID=UPI0036E6E617
MAGGGGPVSQWSVYDGHWPHVPEAAVVRAVCSCGWAGPEHCLNWEVIGDLDLAEGGGEQVDASERDWDGHTAQVETATVPLPETVTLLLELLEEEIDKLTKTSPVAGVRAARRLEVVAELVGYWAGLC